MRISADQFVALPRATVFGFYADPANIAVLHRPGSGVRLLHHSGNVRPGSRTWVEVRVAAILPVVLGFEHTQCNAPALFVDRLIHGPFERFDHFHEFVEADDGTVVRDHLEIELPWWYGGQACMQGLRPVIEHALACRGAWLTALAESGTISRIVGNHPSDEH